MSERGVRRFAEGCVCRTEQVKKDYLAEEPDIVWVLRKLRRVEGMMLSADMLADEIERRFNVCLEKSRWYYVPRR